MSYNDKLVSDNIVLVVSKAIYVRVKPTMSSLLLNIVLYIILFASVSSLLPWVPVATVVASLITR